MEGFLGLENEERFGVDVDVVIVLYEDMLSSVQLHTPCTHTPLQYWVLQYLQDCRLFPLLLWVAYVRRVMATAAVCPLFHHIYW